MIDLLARQAGRALTRHPLRSTLTLLGFAIGVGAFVAMVTFAGAARRSVVSHFETLGAGTLVITAGGGATVNPSLVRLFRLGDVRALADLPGVSGVAPVARETNVATAGARRTLTRVFGTTPAYFEVRAWPATTGGVFDEEDLRSGGRVCVLGAVVAERLGLAQDPVGAALRIGAVDCRVIGVLEPRGQVGGGADQDDSVVIPYSLFERRLATRPGFERILVAVAPSHPFADTRAAVRRTLRDRRFLGREDPDDFIVSSPDELIRMADRTAAILQALLGLIAAVSLLVGGIGIMNILLVSVGERTGEIGLRAALGATPGQILTQFLIEASALSGIGAMAGALLGGVGAALIGGRMGWGGTIPVQLMAVAVAGGIALGLVFGLYPARRAAALDPVAALRGE